MAITARTAARLRAAVGPRGVLDDPDRVAPLLVDERALLRGRAGLVLQPASTAEVAAIARICHDAGVGIVPQGGNTGYCGGATPAGDGEVLLSLVRLNRVRAVDPVGFTLTVEAGVLLADAQAAAAGQDLLFPLSMGSEGRCQIGGNLATNAGGLAVLRYGTARELALGLEVVLADGTVLDGLKGLRKDNTGYDLRDLFIGSEGTLGIITAAVLKLFPRPRRRCAVLLALPDREAACRLLGRARRASGDAIVAFEYLWRPSLELVLTHLDGVRDPFTQRYEHYLLLEFAAAGADPDPARTAERVYEAGAQAGEVLDGVIAASEAQARALWRLRELVPEAERRAGGSIKHDVSVPIARLPALCDEALAAIGQALPRARVSLYGHVGDGNVHLNVLAPAAAPDPDFRRREGPRVSAMVHAVAHALGGSFSAEHGVGVLKRGDLARFSAPPALALMHALKQTLDPRGILNPGKVLGSTSADRAGDAAD